MRNFNLLLFSILFIAIHPSRSSDLPTSIFAHFPVQDNETKIANDITDNLSKKNYEAVRKDFTNSLKEKLNTDIIGQAWENLLTQNGAFVKKISTNKLNVQGYDIVKVRCQFEKDNANVEVTFNDDLKVIGLYLKP